MRILLSTHVVDGIVGVTAFQGSDSGGLSVCRYRDGDDAITELALAVSNIVTLARARGENITADWAGVAIADVKTIRSIQTPEGGTNAYCVYDTARPANSLHAEVMMRVTIVREKRRSAVRQELRKAFGPTLVTKEELLGGRVLAAYLALHSNT
ncbi:hypothetical protein [Paracraurococcus lichenis]|uniref:Uncharacterized protein n=1 Tax=Paracraurococcus lichenis TaxID=3064888 RepID=A0ABT9E570_9PROT|nr:hypothetical protein [Paracraurococcus sp. LOR1-02]MDO9711325.1 hypothetical protein [Paracraurococcus sp. LOR1-02]